MGDYAEKYVDELVSVIQAHEARERALCQMLSDYHGWKSDADLQVAALTYQRQELLAALSGLVDKIADLDDEGLAEYASEMRAARAAITKASK